MRKAILAVVACMFIMSLTVSAFAATKFVGKIKAIDAKKMEMVITTAGKDTTIKVDAEAMGKKLKVGDPVNVILEKEGSNFAKKVHKVLPKIDPGC